MTANSPNPEILYRQYQRIRKSATRSVPAGAQYQDLPDEQKDEQLASLAYRSYQSSRTDSNHEPVDAIMSFIRTENAKGSHNYTGKGTLKVENEDSVESSVIKLASNKRSTRFSSKLRRLSIANIRFIAPAIAASLLAMLIIPQLFEKSDPRDTLSAGMLEHYRLASALIELDKAQSLGFTIDAIDEKRAFDKGLVTKQVFISTIAGDQAKLDLVSSNLQKIIHADDIEILTGVLADVQVSRNTMSSESITKTARDDAANKVIEALHVFRDSLRSSTSGVDSHQWFDLGESIQGILIFAQVHLDFDVSTPFYDELENLRNIEYPANTLSIQKLLDELHLLAEVDVFNSSQLIEIMSICRDIKTLMR